MANIQAGTHRISDIKYSDANSSIHTIQQVKLGGTHVWTRAPAHYWFDLCGFLPGPEWVNEHLTGAIRFVTDGLNGIFNFINGAIDTLGGIVSQIVGFVPNLIASSGIGQMLGINPPDSHAGICGILTSVGGLTQGNFMDGIVGFLNGIPIIGGLLGNLVDAVSNFLHLDDFLSMIGSIPVVGDIARFLGLAPNEDGTYNNPINFIVNAIGDVLGFITCGMITSETIETTLGLVIGGICGLARMLIPDGLISLDPSTAGARYSTVMPADDGYLETVVGSYGDMGLSTQLYRRATNSGTGSNGVGIDLRESSLSIVRRVGTTNTLVAPAGPFTVGDRLRMKQTGDVHTLYRNGAQVAAWNDSGHTAAMGAGYRSLSMTMGGAKENLGPRRFSPSLRYVEAG